MIRNHYAFAIDQTSRYHRHRHAACSSPGRAAYMFLFFVTLPLCLVGRNDRRPFRGAFHRNDGFRAVTVRDGRTTAARKGAARDAGGQDSVGRDQRAAGNATVVYEVHRPVADVVLVLRGRYHERWRQRGGEQRQGRPVLQAEVRARVPWVGVRQEAAATAAQRRHGAIVGHEKTTGEESEFKWYAYIVHDVVSLLITSVLHEGARERTRLFSRVPYIQKYFLRNVGCLHTWVIDFD